MSQPTCPVCFERLGENGGPTTLPCGHNGCVVCMKKVQSLRPECPLCRSAFSQDLNLSLNREFQQLINGSIREEEDWELVESPLQGVIPSAPPLVEEEDALKVLQPPVWMPDSSSDFCLSCTKSFIPLLRTRHHCRLCGGLFCASCSAKRRIFPQHFPYGKQLQRVCKRCDEVLGPFQDLLLKKIAEAENPPINDTFDWKSARSWINLPYSQTMEQDIYKATNIIHTFSKLAKMYPTEFPKKLLEGISGIVILSELKVANGIWSCRFGTGLVLSQDEAQEWSPPSSIRSIGFGPGLQIGSQLMDVILLLPDQSAVDCFMSDVHVELSWCLNGCIGIGVGAQRLLSLKVQTGSEVLNSDCFGFAFCRGVFIGTSIEASLITTRSTVNALFYGEHLTPSQLLTHKHTSKPTAATKLYEQLHRFLHNVK